MSIRVQFYVSDPLGSLPTAPPPAVASPEEAGAGSPVASPASPEGQRCCHSSQLLKKEQM